MLVTTMWGNLPQIEFAVHGMMRCTCTSFVQSNTCQHCCRQVMTLLCTRTRGKCLIIINPTTLVAVLQAAPPVNCALLIDSSVLFAVSVCAAVRASGHGTITGSPQVCATVLTNHDVMCTAARTSICKKNTELFMSSGLSQYRGHF